MTVWVASTLTMEAVCPFKILVPTYLMRWCYDTKRSEHELVCCKYGDSMPLRNDGTLLHHCWYSYIKILRCWHHYFFSPHDLCGQSKLTWTSKGQIPLAVWLLVQVVYLVRDSSSASSHISTICRECSRTEWPYYKSKFFFKLLRVSTRSGNQQAYKVC